MSIVFFAHLKLYSVTILSSVLNIFNEIQQAMFLLFKGQLNRLYQTVYRPWDLTL